MSGASAHEIYSRVRLETDRFVGEGAPRGAVGTIIEVHDDNAYEVDFSDAAGITYAQIVAAKGELVVVR